MKDIKTCDHICSGNCRRVGCNCECGEWHCDPKDECRYKGEECVNHPTFVYNDGGRANAGYKGNTGDCVTRAIAIASGRPYQEVYDRLAEGNATQRRSRGRKHSKDGVRTASRGINTTRKWYKDYMKELGFEWKPTMFIGQGCKVHLKANELPKGNLVVNVSKHYVAVIDGVINDTYNPSRDGTRCVYGYYIKIV